MSSTDCSNNRFISSSTKKNIFMSKSNISTNNIEEKSVNTRWVNLSYDSDENRQKEKYNTFKKPRNAFSDKSKRFYGDRTDKYGNYKGSPFRRETRPKTPPPKEFKMEEKDFPPLG